MSSKLQPQLVIIEGKDKGKVIPLRQGSLIFGRSKGDVIVQDPRVSRSHVSIHFDSKSGKISFTDLKSLNGTLINGEVSTQGELNDGDQLQVGDTTFDIQFSGEVTSEDRDPEPEKRLKAEPKLSREPVPESNKTQAKETSRKSKNNKQEGKQSGKRSGLLSKLSPRARIAAMLLVLVSGLYLFMGDPSQLGGSSVEDGLRSVQDLVGKGEIQAAAQAAEDLNTAHPEDFRVKRILGELYTLLGKNESAIGVYREAMAMEGAPDIFQLKLIMLLVRSGKEGEATDALSQLDRIVKAAIDQFTKLTKETTPEVVFEKNPELREVFITAAHIVADLKDFKGTWDDERSMVFAAGLTRIVPNDPIGFVLNAQVALRRGDVNIARKNIQDAIKRDSKDPWILQKLANLQFEVQDYDGASVTVQNWASLTPDTPALNFIMAKLEAQTAIEESNALVDGNAISEKMKQVLSILKKAGEYNGNDRWVLEQKALALLKRYELEEALATTEQWLKLYPNSSKASIVMVYIMFYEGRSEEALPIIQKVITMAQKGGDERYLPDAVYLYGRALAQQNKIEEAKEYIRQACNDLKFQEACQDNLLAGEQPAPESAAEEEKGTANKANPNARQPDSVKSAPQKSLPTSSRPQKGSRLPRSK